MAGIHICVVVAAQTADYLGLVENVLDRYTRKEITKSAEKVNQL